jgi:hypothetical protein
MKKLWSWIKNVVGWVILIAIAIIGLAAGLIFFSYIIVYILGVLVGVMLLVGFLYLILKLIGFR